MAQASKGMRAHTGACIFFAPDRKKGMKVTKIIFQIVGRRRQDLSKKVGCCNNYVSV